MRSSLPTVGHAFTPHNLANPTAHLIDDKSRENKIKAIGKRKRKKKENRSRNEPRERDARCFDLTRGP